MERSHTCYFFYIRNTSCLGVYGVIHNLIFWLQGRMPKVCLMLMGFGFTTAWLKKVQTHEQLGT